MKTIVHAIGERGLVGLAGAVALLAGLWLRFSLGVALIGFGLVLLYIALWHGAVTKRIAK